MSWPKRIFAALFIVTIAGIVTLSLLPRDPPPFEVEVAKVRRGSITRNVTAAGKLQAATEVKVSSNLSGDLLELSLREGDLVKRGQLLARIDARRYAAQVRQQEAARASGAADLALERVQLARVVAELERVRRLVASSSASAAELERAGSDVAGQQARVQAVEERLAQADAALAEARHFLSLTTIYSPIDGTVTSRLKQVGERVRGSDFSEDIILVIATLSTMEASVEVGEHEVVYLHTGDRADIEIDALPDQKWPAQVIEIARNANIKNRGTEAEVTTFPVRLALTAPVPNALPGMSAQATIATDTHDGALIVPIQSVTARPEADKPPDETVVAQAAPSARAASDAPPGPARKGRMQKLVFVVDGGVARANPVQVGLANENEIEITAGVADGASVVTGPYRVLTRDLADGKRVTIAEPGKARAGGRAGKKP